MIRIPCPPEDPPGLSDAQVELSGQFPDGHAPGAPVMDEPIPFLRPGTPPHPEIAAGIMPLDLPQEGRREGRRSGPCHQEMAASRDSRNAGLPDRRRLNARMADAVERKFAAGSSDLYVCVDLEAP